MDNLKARTGIETILYATRGSTDLPLQGITFNTEGVDNFMESVIGVSAEDFVGKMEGFAVQGVQGDLSSFPSGKNNVYNGVPFRRSKKSSTASYTTSQLDSRSHKP